MPLCINCVHIALWVLVSSPGLSQEPAAPVAFSDTFSAETLGWRPQGQGLKATLEASDLDEDQMLKLDNSASDSQAFVGIEVGEPGALMAFSLMARAEAGTSARVGLHRYQGAIHWEEVQDHWRRVSWEARAHQTVAMWYVAVGPGSVAYVDAVTIAPIELSEAERVARLAAIRAASTESALEAYRALDPVDPAPGSCLTVEGRFPVGFYAVRPVAGRDLGLEGIFRELAEAKVNVLHNSDFEDWPEHTPHYRRLNSDETARLYLDLAHSHGLQVLMGFDRMMVVKGDAAGLQRRARTLTDHPGLFGWYLIDEPNLHGAGPQVTLAAREAVRDAGDGHPLTATLCDIDTIDRYAPSLDVLITDVYPVSTECLFSLVPHIETALAATEGQKPVWAAIGVHNHDMHRIAWGGMEHLIPDPRRPTVDEVRCMTYLAIAHGAGGILFYAYDAWRYGQIYDEPVLYEGVKALSRELADLSPWLVGDCVAKGTVAGERGTMVSYILRGRHQGQSVLVAVNGFDEPSGPVQISVPGTDSVAVELGPQEVLVRKVPATD